MKLFLPHLLSRETLPTLIFTTVLTALTSLNIQAEEVEKNDATKAKDKLNLPVLTAELPEVIVTATGTMPASTFMPETAAAKIYSGKKTTVTELSAIPQIQNNNYRQVFSQTPGLLVSEHTNAGFINMNYRGIGDPHETEFLLTLKDGIPQGQDLFGYSTLYALPPMEGIERVEFVRGGSSLLYGPQPGPVINFISKRPPTDKKITGSTQHIIGSDGLYTNYSTVGGTVDRIGYSLTYFHKQQDGTRNNADSVVNGGNVQIALDADKSTRWLLDINTYVSESGEPGRLSAGQYSLNRDFTRTPNDRIFIERHTGAISVEHDISPDTMLVAKAWVGYQERQSRRPDSTLNATIDTREFQFGGVDARILHNYYMFNNKHTLTGGFMVYSADNPRKRDLAVGDPLATTGTRQFTLENTTNYGAYFIENKFTFGSFSIVPAVRIENTAVNVKETQQIQQARGPQEGDYLRVVPLLGLGLEYKLGNQNTTYANISQGYRPASYDSVLNPGSSAQPSSTLNEAKTWTYEIGFRGQPTPWFNYDTSVFYTDYDNYFETTGPVANPVITNSGRAKFMGWEAAAEIDFVGLYDAANKSDVAKRFGTLSAYSNVSLLSAKFVSGINEGREPGYAPGYVFKTGTIYRYSDKVKISFIGTMFGNHDWRDNNVPANGVDEIPAYGVWDLTAEIAIYKDYVKLLGGINNIFDEDYFARVRTDGIEPAARRNYYVGVRVSF